MIDYFSIALTHGLIALACWRLLFCDALDEDDPPPAGRQAPERPWLKNRAPLQSTRQPRHPGAPDA